MNQSQAAFCTLSTGLSDIGMEIDMDSPLFKGSKWSPYFTSHTDGCGDFFFNILESVFSTRLQLR